MSDKILKYNLVNSDFKLFQTCFGFILPMFTQVKKSKHLAQMKLFLPMIKIAVFIFSFEINKSFAKICNNFDLTK